MTICGNCITAFEANAAAADIECFSQPLTLDATLVDQLVFDVQRNGVAPVGTLVGSTIVENPFKASQRGGGHLSPFVTLEKPSVYIMFGDEASSGG
jgi:hypothetical protein